MFLFAFGTEHLKHEIWHLKLLTDCEVLSTDHRSTGECTVILTVWKKGSCKTILLKPIFHELIALDFQLSNPATPDSLLTLTCHLSYLLMKSLTTSIPAFWQFSACMYSWTNCRIRGNLPKSWKRDKHYSNCSRKAFISSSIILNNKMCANCKRLQLYCHFFSDHSDKKTYYKE